MRGREQPGILRFHERLSLDVQGPQQ